MVRARVARRRERRHPACARSVARGARVGADRGEGAHRARPRTRDQGGRSAHPQCRVGELRRRVGRVGACELARRRVVHAPHDLFRLGGRTRRRRFGNAVGLRVRRGPHSFRPRSRVHPARRGHACVPPPRRQAGSRSAYRGDPRSARHPFGARRAVERVQRRVDVEGPFVVRGPRRREDRRALHPARRRSHRRACTRRVAVRRRRHPHPAQRAHRRRRDAGLPAQRVHRSAVRFGHHRERHARYRLDAGCRRTRAAARARSEVRRKRS